MSVFRKAAEYLGLVDDEEDEVYEYESYDDYGDEAPAPRAAAPRTRAAAPATDTAAHTGVAPGGAASGAVTLVRPIRPDTPSADAPARSSVAKVHVLEPHGFNDAQEVGDRLKAGQPVVLNLQGLDRDLQRRLIDFSSGLCYALSGAMAKAADHVFLLTPPNVDVSDDDKERLRDRGLYRR
jgi:cell division inhibitor SepF